MRNILENLLGKIGSRLMFFAARYDEAQRDKALAQIARIDPTARVDQRAGLANATRDPDRLRIGASTSMMGELIVHPNGGRIVIGDHCFVGPGSRLWSAASIEVGDYVLISHDVNIHDNISHSLDWRERAAEIDAVLPGYTLHAHEHDIKASPVVIGDHAWIGFGASIMGGVRIGRGAVVGAHTVVTADVPDFTVVIGNPMRVLRTLSESEADALNAPDADAG